MIDVSVTAQKAHAAKFAASFEPSIGPAGYEKTRREPPTLTDKQYQTLDRFAALVPKERRSTYHSTVLARLSGVVGDAAVIAACFATAADGYIADEKLVEHGLVVHKDYSQKWQSRAILGTERKSTKRRKR